MTEDELQKFVESWDIHEYEENSSEPAADPEDFIKRKEHEGRYDRMLQELLFLEKHFFKEYDLNQPRDFMGILRDWLEQFDKNDPVLNSEKRYAFILAYKIIFFNCNQIISLLNVVWDKIKKELLRIAAIEKSIPLSNVIFDKDLMDRQLENSVFVPLSDSSHFMEFRHHCLPEGESESLIIPSFDRLHFPLKKGNSDQIEEIKKLYKTKTNLFIIEDFSGSGTTIYNTIKEIIKHYGFKNIFFCPYIINTKAKEKFNGLYKFAEENGKHFEMLYGIQIEKDYSISEEIGSDFWMPDEKEALKAMSIKYFEKYFAGNGYLYMDFTTENPQRSTPFGFKNGGLAIVLYSNCPNNSLPIIWSNDGGWVPLFLRHERYIKRIKK